MRFFFKRNSAVFARVFNNHGRLTGEKNGRGAKAARRSRALQTRDLWGIGVKDGEE